MHKNILLLLLLVTASAHAFDPFVVDDIRIIGADRISQGTIFTHIPIERGDEVDSSRIRDAIKSLFGTGYFEDIKMAREGGILLITVVERPAIATISISGNKSIKTEELLSGLENIGLAEGEVFNELELERVKNELVQQFFSRGKYNVEVKTKFKELDRNRVLITIDIDEGKSAKIKHIKVVGNTVFSDSELTDRF